MGKFGCTSVLRSVVSSFLVYSKCFSIFSTCYEGVLVIEIPPPREEDAQLEVICGLPLVVFGVQPFLSV